MKKIIPGILIVLALFIFAVLLPGLKCKSLAAARQAGSYSYSPLRGCYLDFPNTHILLSPGYLRSLPSAGDSEVSDEN